MISRVRRIVCCFFFLAGVGLVQTGSNQKTGLLKPSGNKDPTIIQVSARLEEARSLLLSGNYRQAEELYQAACREAAELREPIWAGRCLTGLGNCRYSLFRYREALNAFLEAREFARRAGDWPNIGTLDGNISSLYLMMGDLDAAANAAQLAPEEIQHGGSTQGLALSLIQLGAIRARQGRMEESAGAIGRAIDIASRDGDFATVAQAWDHWGEELLARGARREADRALTEAFRLRKMLGLTKLGSSYYNLARLRLAEGDPESASAPGRCGARSRASSRQPGLPLGVSSYSRRSSTGDGPEQRRVCRVPNGARSGARLAARGAAGRLHAREFRGQARPDLFFLHQRGQPAVFRHRP